MQRECRRESAAELGEHLRCGQCVAAAAAGALLGLSKFGEIDWTTLQSVSQSVTLQWDRNTAHTWQEAEQLSTTVQQTILYEDAPRHARVEVVNSCLSFELVVEICLLV